MMLPITASRQLEPTDYQWKQSRYSSKLWQRRALASEVMWLARPKDSRELFVSVCLTLQSPTFHSRLISASKSAWQQLRYEAPELVLNGLYERDGKAYMQYQTPQTQEDIRQWVERTSAFDFGEQRQDFEDLQEKVLYNIRGQDADNVFLFLHAQNKDRDFLPASSIQLMLYVDHQVVDGIGARILLGRYLSLLASLINTSSNPPECKLNWEESHNKLSTPWICLLNENQALSGIKYNETILWNQGILTKQMKNNHGIPLLQLQKPETQERHFITLPRTQSISLLAGVKQAVGCDSNITHLGHAAMVLALLRSNPLPETPPRSPPPLYSPCWLNGRRYLLSSSTNPVPTKDYIPVCLSFAPIIFPDLRELSLPRSAGAAAIKPMLVKSCKIATAEYGKIKARKSILPECVTLFESLGEKMREQLQKSESLEDEQNTTPKVQIKPTSPSTAEPFFLSDGITEQYINRQYLATSSGASSQPMFEVDDVKFAANAEKNLIVRMSSWGDRITISGEWRGCDYDRGMVEGFLEDVRGIMLSVLE